MVFLGCAIKHPVLAFAVLATYAVAYGCLNTYLPAMVTTLEKRFDLDSTRMGYLLSGNDIGYMLTIISVAYYGGHNNHVRCLVISSIGLSLSGIVFGLPIVLFGPRYSLEQLLASNASGTSGAALGGAAMIYNETCRTSVNVTMAQRAIQGPPAISPGEQTTVFVIQLIAGILNGMASSPFWNVGVSFLDDISGKQSGGYIGLLLAIRCVAPILGFLLAAFLNFINESVLLLARDYASGQKDPFWIGAWWLGFFILGFTVLSTAPFLAMFDTKALQKRASAVPKPQRRISQPRRPEKEGEDEAAGEALTKMEESSFVSDIYGDREPEPEIEAPAQLLSFRDMVKVYKKLWSNPVFLFNMIGKVLEICSNMMFITFFPKFLELHFRLTASQANIASAFLLAGSAIVGLMISGQLQQRLPFSPRGSNFFHFISNATATALFPLLFAFVCPAKPMLGSPQYSLNATSLTCLRRDCECDETYKPVCIDGANYYSACKAVCMSFDKNQELFQNCLCSGKTAQPGMCADVCGLLYPYGVLCFIVRTISAVAIVHFMKMNMGLTEKRNKPISLASVGLLYGICGSAFPPLLGHIFDSSCLMYNSASSGRSFCARYDVEKLRVMLHLLSFLPLIPSSICYFISWFVMKDSNEGIVQEKEMDVIRRKSKE